MTSQAPSVSFGNATTAEAAVVDMLTVFADSFIAVQTLNHFNLAPDAPSAEDIWEVIRIGGERTLHWRRTNHLLAELTGKAPDRVFLPAEARMLPVYRELLADWIEMLAFESTVGCMERLWLEETFGTTNEEWKTLGRRIWEEKENHLVYAHSRLYAICLGQSNRRRAQAALHRLLPEIRLSLAAIPDGPAYREAGMRTRDGATLWDTLANELGPILEGMDLDPGEASWQLAGQEA